MVTRLKIDPRGFTLEKDDNGYLVRFDDYKELEQRLKGVSSLCEKAMSNEVAWEKEMAKAVGKDSPGTVGEEIEKLKLANYELQQKMDAMAAENAALKKSNPNLKTVGYLAQLIGKLASMDYHPLRPVDYRISDINAWLRNYHDNKTPVTDDYLNSVRAEGVEMFALCMAEEAIKDEDEYHDKSTASNLASSYAEAMRSGIHDTADKEG